MPRKVDPRKLKADWSKFERRPVWAVISSRELASVLDVSLQTINNWHVRCILPAPVKHPRLRANKNYWRIQDVRSWLNGTTPDEEARLWLAIHGSDYGLEDIDLEQAKSFCRACWRSLGIECEKPLLS